MKLTTREFGVGIAAAGLVAPSTAWAQVRPAPAAAGEVAAADAELTAFLDAAFEAQQAQAGSGRWSRGAGTVGKRPVEDLRRDGRRR